MIDYNLCYTIPMIIKHTRDTLSETYLDAVAIRNTVFVKGQEVPRSIDIDANEAYCIHFVLYDDKGQATATVRLLPNHRLDTSYTPTHGRARRLPRSRSGQHPPKRG